MVRQNANIMEKMSVLFGSSAVESGIKAIEEANLSK
jgi:hypothetical protein